MSESKVMKELREARDKISEEIRDMDTKDLKEYFKSNAEAGLDEIKKIRDKRKAI